MADINNSKLLQTSTGILKKDACVVLVKTEWNAAITDELERGCREELERLGVRKINTLTVPGAFEIPFAIKQHWEESGKKKRAHAYIAIGCVIQGDTPHFDYVCRAVTDGVLHLILLLPVPSIFAVLSVNNDVQGRFRIGG